MKQDDYPKIVKGIENWVKERLLLDKPPVNQILKFYEEFGELCKNYLRLKSLGEDSPEYNKLRMEVIDGLGDSLVVVTVMMTQLYKSADIVSEVVIDLNAYRNSADYELVQWANSLFVEFSGRALYTGDEPLTVDILSSFVSILNGMANKVDTNIVDALASVYFIINQRTGKIVDGVFVKDEAHELLTLNYAQIEYASFKNVSAYLEEQKDKIGAPFRLEFVC